jgi:hypothetical protein
LIAHLKALFATFICSTFCLNSTRTDKVIGGRIQFQESLCPCAYLGFHWCHHSYLQQIGVDMPCKIHSHVFVLFSQERCLSGKRMWLIVRDELQLLQQHPLQRVSLPWLSFGILSLIKW